MSNLVTRLVSGCILAGTLVVMSAPGATALSGGPKSCNVNYHVYTQSKSSGYTYHTHYKGAGTYSWNFGNVSPASPWRTFHSGQFRSIDGWGVAADVLETAYAGCTQNPI